MNILTIIPARGGSKGVRRKNVRFVGGKPLLAWTILAAKSSIVGRNCYVSTEDDEISNLAQHYGANVISRPLTLASDTTPTVAVVLHALNICEEKIGKQFSHILLLQPTAPLRQSVDIDQSVDILLQRNADSVISVYRVEDAHPARMYRIVDGMLQPFHVEPTGTLRQDLSHVYHRNGAIYACKRELIIKESNLWGGKMIPYVMPKSRSINIDDEQDLFIAGCLLGSN